jgi:hypothetical protein
MKDGEQSYEGIVARKLARKAAIASDPALPLPGRTLTQKAGESCEARNRGRKATNEEEMRVFRLRSGSQEARRTDAEQKGRRSDGVHVGNDRLPNFFFRRLPAVMEKVEGTGHKQRIDEEELSCGSTGREETEMV